MRLLRLREVLKVTGLSRTTIYRLESRGKFPSRRQLSANAVAWLEDDVSAWIGARPTSTGRDPCGDSHDSASTAS